MANSGNFLNKLIRFENKIAFIYFVIGMAWIYFSDTLAGSLTDNQHLLTKINIFKGFAYAILTALLLFFYVRKHMSRLRKSEEIANQKSIEIAAQNQELLKVNADLQVAKNLAEINERNYREAQALAHVGNWELDLEDHSLYWSDEVYRIFGLEPDEYVATYETFLGFVHPDDLNLVEKSYHDHITNFVPYNIVHRIIRPDKSVRYVNEKCLTNFNSSGKAIRLVGTIADITEQKIARDALLRTQHSIDNVTDSILWVDSGAKIVNANQSACRNLEFSMDELLTKTIFDVDPIFRREHWADHWESLSIGSSFMLETQHQTSS